MKDQIYCPICQNKLSNLNFSSNELDGLLDDLPPDIPYVRRSCSQGYNHALFFYSEPNKNIDLIHFTLPPNYSKFVSINYLNKISTIRIYQNQQTNIIKLNAILEPDFPNLNNLIQEVNLITLFS